METRLSHVSTQVKDSLDTKHESKPRACETPNTCDS